MRDRIFTLLGALLALAVVYSLFLRRPDEPSATRPISTVFVLVAVESGREMGVEAEGVARITRDTRAGEVVPFAPTESKAQPIRQLDAEVTTVGVGDAHRRASHSSRRGHPAAIHSRSSSARQR